MESIYFHLIGKCMCSFKYAHNLEVGRRVKLIFIIENLLAGTYICIQAKLGTWCGFVFRSSYSLDAWLKWWAWFEFMRLLCFESMAPTYEEVIRRKMICIWSWSVQYTRFEHAFYLMLDSNRTHDLTDTIRFGFLILLSNHRCRFNDH